MSLSREERIAAQDGDHGDPDDDVFVSNQTTSSSGTYKYHNTRECRALATLPDEDVWELPRSGAQRRWLAPCNYCILGSHGYGTEAEQAGVVQNQHQHQNQTQTQTDTQTQNTTDTERDTA
jgi:hypothetical protein